MVVEHLCTRFSFLLGKNIGGEIYVHLSKDYPTPVFSELLLQFTLADEKQKEEN